MVIFGQHWNWKRRKTMTKEELMNAIMGLPEVKMKAERIQQLKKAYIFYWRRIRTLLATGRYLLTIDYRKKDINNEK